MQELETLEKRVEAYKLHSDVDSLVKIVDIGSNLEMELRNAKELAEDFNLRLDCLCLVALGSGLLHRLCACLPPQ